VRHSLNGWVKAKEDEKHTFFVPSDDNLRNHSLLRVDKEILSRLLSEDDVNYRDHPIGYRIALLREMKGWNQRQLAEQIEMTQQTLSKIEKMTESTFQFSTAVKLSRALDMPLEWFK